MIKRYKKAGFIICFATFIAIAVLLVFRNEEPDKTGIVVEPVNWLLGDVQLDQKFETQIKINSFYPVEIIKARPSCQCIATEIVKPIADKEADGIIKAKLTVKKELGTHFKAFIYIHLKNSTTAPKQAAEAKPQILRFDIQGNIQGTAFDLKETEITLFYTKTATDIGLVQEKLKQLQQKNPSFAVKEYSLANTESYRLLAKYEKEFSVKEHGKIEMFKGNKYFIDADEILLELNQLFSTNQLAIEPDENAVEIVFFYSAVCRDCQEIKEKLFPKLKEKYGNRIFIKELDVYERENYECLVALEDEFKIKANSLVTIFVGKNYLLGKNQVQKNLEGLIEESLNNPEKERVLKGIERPKPIALYNRFKSFDTMAVMLAGLLDGINPCVFATIIFFISFLTFAGRTRKEILTIGITYILIVFATYLLLGVGLFKTIQVLSAFRTVSDILLYLTIVIVFALAALSFYDLMIYLKTRQAKKMTLQLPLSLKQKIHTVIRQNVKLKGLIIGAIVIGFFVTLFETVCTGQVYLPTIVFMLQEPLMKANALIYLVLYNVMFILPLIAIFLLAYSGVSSQRFNELSQKNVIIIKAALTIFFTGLGMLLLV